MAFFFICIQHCMRKASAHWLPDSATMWKQTIIVSLTFMASLSLANHDLQFNWRITSSLLKWSYGRSEDSLTLTPISIMTGWKMTTLTMQECFFRIGISARRLRRREQVESGNWPKLGCKEWGRTTWLLKGKQCSNLSHIYLCSLGHCGQCAKHLIRAVRQYSNNRTEKTC